MKFNLSHISHRITLITVLVIILMRPYQPAFGEGEPHNLPKDASIDFGRDIQPLLATNCYRCHGPDEQEGGLRLDLKKRILEGGDSGLVIKPGKSSESEILRRITSDDESDRMPPDGKRLDEKQITRLRAWIDAGAQGIPDDGPGRPTVKHWAFLPIVRPEPPSVSDIGWVRNPIDRYVLAKLASRNFIKPAPEAPRETLIRRLSLDVTGLLPSVERVAEFVADARPDAYERLVDELLQSPHFGERWGRHWLDLARYADSTGYESDKPREIWPYRDWVIGALNRNMPYDQFVVEQIAGDLLPEATSEHRIATGFHCNAMLDPGVRWESIIDRVNTTGTVFLGLTVGCAQCHTHKTDPITQREFYEFYAFFNDATVDNMELALTSGAGDSKTKTTTLVMKQTPQPTNIFRRGDPAQPGERVSPGVPAFLHELKLVDASAPNRLDLARWLVAPDNPLTPRVTVNRVWQRYFGLGLVETENDFGRQTAPPEHRELLDYLADEFRSQGWGLKRLHRLILTSATYRQSSDLRRDLATIDPNNRLLARQRRLRLESEIIRDVSLAAAGLLSHKIGGPSVFPYQPDGILNNRATPATWTVSEGENRYRRGMYTWVWRLTQHPHLPLFDAPDGITSCTRRDRSNVPVQALTLLNDPTFVECARGLAERACSDPKTSDDDRIKFVFRVCLSRAPQSVELEILRKLLAGQRQSLAAHPAEAKQIVEGTPEFAGDPIERAAWIVLCRSILNLDEFITRE